MTSSYITRVPGLVFRDVWLHVPLDYNAPHGETITLFARVVSSTTSYHKAQELPFLVYLQGGPGFAAPRPLGNSGWLKRALSEYRVVLLDQRGVGYSSPIICSSLSDKSPAEQAAYLSHFRADNIVRDCERLRQHLMPAGGKWSLLGQSFGGFCATTYLSLAPEGLEAVILTGGLPPMLCADADPVYKATFQRTLTQNAAYFERYPDDQLIASAIARRLLKRPLTMPDGGLLTCRRFQQLGFFLGLNSFERIHFLLEQAAYPYLSSRFVAPDSTSTHHHHDDHHEHHDNDDDNAATHEHRTHATSLDERNALIDDIESKLDLGLPFVKAIDSLLTFDTNPLYAILHEAIYCSNTASRWSAHRVQNEFYPQFNLALAADGRRLANDQQFLFTGEMVYPWMFDDYAALRPLKEAAEILARKDDWPALYDIARLRTNTVPVVAAIYYDDMYVDHNLSIDTLRAIACTKKWVTDEYEHSGIRTDGERVLGRLLDILHGDLY